MLFLIGCLEVNNRYSNQSQYHVATTVTAK